MLQDKIRENIQKMTRKQKIEFLEELEEYDTRKKENLCKKYLPNKKCEQFINQVGSNKHFINLFSAANGVGKTAVGVNIVANMCFKPQNKWFKGQLYEDFPYLKRGRIISDPTTIKEKIVPELRKWFPSNRYKTQWQTQKDGKNYESKWVTDTGFEFDIMSNEQDAKEFESTDLGWVWLDEPSRKDIYIATIARLRMGGTLIWTMTPLSYSAWIKDEIYDKRDGKDIEYVTADVWDNCVDREGTRGILTEENINRMINQYPEDEKQARIYGKFGHLLGRVHKTFDRKIHVIKPFKIDPTKYVVAKAHDTHPRVEDHIIWMAIDEKNTKYFINELVINGTVAEISTRIKQIEKINNYRMIDDLIDPSAFNFDKRSKEKPIGEQFYYEGINYRKGSKDLVGSIRRTDDALYFEEKDGHMVVAPEVYFFDTLSVAIPQLENYVWDEYRGRIKDEKQPKASPKDKNDHQPENIHRLIVEELEFKEMEHESIISRLKRSNKKQASYKQTTY